MAVNTMLQENARDGKKGKRVRVLLADDHPAVVESRHDEESKRYGVVVNLMSTIEERKFNLRRPESRA